MAAKCQEDMRCGEKGPYQSTELALTAGHCIERPGSRYALQRMGTSFLELQS
jgi:hypothetical protein